MNAFYVELLYNQNGQRCLCRSHSQHRLFEFQTKYPLATLKDAAKALDFEYRYTRLLASRLNRRNRALLCLVCFKESVLNGVCQHCGYLKEEPVLNRTPEFKSASPVHRIQPGSHGLGTVLTQADCRTILRPGLKVEGIEPHDISKRAFRLFRENQPRSRDRVTEGALSDVWQALKSAYPDDRVSDEAARLVAREMEDFRLRYPDLRPSGLRVQIARLVVAELERRYPELKRRLRLPERTNGKKAQPQHRNMADGV